MNQRQTAFGYAVRVGNYYAMNMKRVLQLNNVCQPPVVLEVSL